MDKKKWTDDEVLALMAKKQSKKRMETSKKILIVSTLTCYLLIFIGVVLAWYRSDSMVLKIMASGVVSAQTTAVGFYFWKSKQENVLKLKAAYKDEFVAIEEASRMVYYNSPDSSEGRDISSGV